MNSKNGRHNTDFQIAYFLAGSCHTADGAYAVLCDALRERRSVLKGAEAVALRVGAKKWNLGLLKAFLGWWPGVRLWVNAWYAEMEAHRESSDVCLAAAVAEVDFLERCIEKIQPHRKYSRLPDAEAHEAAQKDEWRLELIRRAENAMMGQALGLPASEVSTMRMHPEFKTHILPAIEQRKFEINDSPLVAVVEQCLISR